MRSIALLFAMFAAVAGGVEHHVSVKGSDSNPGTAAEPFRTISAATRVAQPGDTITVHAGTYRERVTPPRGGESDAKRIVYQAARGEQVIIKGSEIARGWKPYQGRAWKLTVPNSFFGTYNPYKDLIVGDWFTDRGRPHHTGEVYLNGKALFETNLLDRVVNPQPFRDARDQAASLRTWYTESDDQNTHIFANFQGANPNDELVEINVRDSCFYPDQPGRNFITVRGFQLRHAATQWAAPTAEQIGLIGTHWSKGWIIENNEISDSKCSCVTLGKDRKSGHNVWINDPKKDGATHYNEVVVRALEDGWSREKIGSHIVRNNTIHDCDQAGIAGSLGAVFSRITRNHIYNVWAKRQFTGAEMAGIKLHAAIDVLIEGNRIHNAGRGLWMDWMAQGTRITRNLLYDNTTDDLFVEVNHGPFLVDNNLFLSGTVSLLDMSEGGAYVHNLMNGSINTRPEPNRVTPFHPPHSTKVAATIKTTGGDNRFYNNVFVGGTTAAANRGWTAGFGLWVYDAREYPLMTGGNVYLRGARPYVGETGAVDLSGADPRIKLSEEAGNVFLTITPGDGLAKARGVRVTTALLGKSKVSGAGYENPDGTPLAIDTGYFGKKRAATPVPGPFETLRAGPARLKVW